MRRRLIFSSGFALLTFVNPCAFGQTIAHVWPIHFKQPPESLMDVNYIQESNGNNITIKASVIYLDHLKASIPITAQHFWISPFEWNMPRLAVKTENSTDTQIALDRMIISVDTSQIDKSPIPIFVKDAIREVILYNDGWGDLNDAQIQLGLLPGRACEGDTVIEKSSLQQIKTVNLGRISTESAKVEIGDLINTRFSGAGRACAVGILTYTDERAGKWLVPFRTGVWLGHPLVGAAMPPNTTYDLYLQAGRSGYITEIPISQAIPAKGVDHFQVAVYSDKSATFEFAATVVSDRQKQIAKSNVKLTYFRPRSALTPVTPASRYKDVEIGASVAQELAPYVTSIRYDPLRPEDFYIQATEEWMLLSNARRTAVNQRIESDLSKLGLTGASYCYQIKDDCVKTGSFKWK